MDPELQEVKLLRKRLGLTQEQLAQAANVSQSLIAKVEAGLVDPSFTAGKRILEALRAMEQRQEPAAKALMQRHVVHCRPDGRLKGAIATMRRHAFSQLPVMESDNVVGILSESAIVRNMEGIDPDRTLVRDVMEEAPPILPPETPRKVVAELLKHYSLVLVKEKGKVQGLITKADLLKSV
jgi:predicted transcriptional regulator